MRPLPTTERGRRSRAAIVEAAGQLMYERGLAAPSMDDVLVASGTGKSQLYHYFEGKQELTIAVLHHHFDMLMARQAALFDPDCADLCRWRDEVLRGHRRGGQDSCALGAFVGQVYQDPVLKSTLAALFTRWQDAIADLVARAIQAGRVHPDTDPGVAGTVLLTALQGGTMLSRLHGDWGLLAQALDRALRDLLVDPVYTPAGT